MNGGVEFGAADDGVDESDFLRSTRGKARPGEKQLTRRGPADFRQHKRRDDGREDAEFDLGESELRRRRSATAISQTAARPTPPPSAAP